MDIILNENDFYTGLVNFILFMRLYATNTSKKQKSITDVLCTETLEYGDRKAYPFAELPKVSDYSTTSTLLADNGIKYSEEFIGDPIKKKIPLSRCEPFAKMAMMNASGMSAFMSYILGLMESAKEDYLYNEIMKDLITWTPTNSTGKKMVQTINLRGIAANTAASEEQAAYTLNQRDIQLAWQRLYDDFSLYTDLFIDIDNGSGGTATNFKTAIDKSDLIFIGNAKFLNEQIIDQLVVFLKSNLIDEKFSHPHILKVPEKTFEDNSADSIIGFVAHKHWYQWFYHFNFMGSFFDPDTLRIKNVLHFWYSKGRLKNLPAAKLVANMVTA